MKILARLGKALGIVATTEPPVTSLDSTVPKAVPAFDLVICGTCEQPFYRSRSVHPDLACIDCQMKQWDVWIQNYEARQAIDGSFIRRLS